MEHVDRSEDAEAAPDAFIRNVTRPGRKLQGRLFRCKEREKGISLYARTQELASDDDLQVFQQHNRLPSGDLPALWPVMREDIDQVGLAVHLVPEDEEYGHLHWESTECPTEDQADRLAMIATQRGALLKFVPAPKD